MEELFPEAPSSLATWDPPRGEAGSVPATEKGPGTEKGVLTIENSGLPGTHVTVLQLIVVPELSVQPLIELEAV